jgi:hypothetical protein
MAIRKRTKKGTSNRTVLLGKRSTPLPKLLEKAQRVFNKYVRERDSQDGYFTCISCSRVLPVDKMNAGHFVPVKNGSFLRLHEWNVSGECQYCNCFDEFHLIRYRKNLIEKIGLEAVEWLEANSRTVKKWTREELEEIIKKYS